MADFFSALGIDWKLLLAQAVNFLIIFLILRFTAYKPIMAMFRLRREKIEQGVIDAEAAGNARTSAEKNAKERMAVADRDSIAIFTQGEARAKERESVMMKEVEMKRADMIVRAEGEAKEISAKAEQVVYNSAVDLVRRAVHKIAALSPEAIDEALVEQALSAVRAEPKA